MLCRIPPCSAVEVGHALYGNGESSLNAECLCTEIGCVASREDRRDRRADPTEGFEGSCCFLASSCSNCAAPHIKAGRSELLLISLWFFVFAGKRLRVRQEDADGSSHGLAWTCRTRQSVKTRSAIFKAVNLGERSAS